MLISDVIFNRMKSLGISNGVFLFVSNDKENLESYALSFARNLLDYSKDDSALNERIYRPEGDFITADQVNDFISFESKKAVSVKAKILIMYDIDLLKDSVSDKMLKCIEDYSSDSFIVFTTTALESVSRTIRSRCMVFRSWTDSVDIHVTFKDKFLGFLDQISQATDYSEVESISKDVSNQSVMDVIQALFANAKNEADLVISKNALDAHLTGSQPEQVFSYIINSYWCLYHNLRSWENAGGAA